MVYLTIIGAIFNRADHGCLSGCVEKEPDTEHVARSTLQRTLPKVPKDPLRIPFNDPPPEVQHFICLVQALYNVGVLTIHITDHHPRF